MKARDPEAARQRMADFDARVLPIILELRDKGMSINVIARKRGLSQHGRASMDAAPGARAVGEAGRPYSIRATRRLQALRV